MATYKDHKIKKGTPPQTVWKNLQDQLLEGESVEVIIEYDEDDNPVNLWMRVWDDVRKDKSNDFHADPNKQY